MTKSPGEGAHTILRGMTDAQERARDEPARVGIDEAADPVARRPVGDDTREPRGVQAEHHGGPDALGAPAWDFSTNVSPLGPPPELAARLQRVDASRYPDPAATRLRAVLGDLHGVDPARIVVAASGSEAIARLTAASARLDRGTTVWTPPRAYADYRRHAEAWGLPAAAAPGAASLVWHAEPGSPDGRAEPAPEVAAGARLVIDEAYAPLRLQGPAPERPPRAWRLIVPNKALGLAGVRAAYLVVPEAEQEGELHRALLALAPSWPIGAHGVEMLAAWAEPEVEAWLADALPRLRDWKAAQLALCRGLGWECRASVVPFYVARWPGPPPGRILARLRAHGVKLRDAAELGMPGWVRVAVRPPAEQAALVAAWAAVTGREGPELRQASRPAPTAARRSSS